MYKWSAPATPLMTVVAAVMVELTTIVTGVVDVTAGPAPALIVTTLPGADKPETVFGKHGPPGPTVPMARSFASVKRIGPLVVAAARPPPPVTHTAGAVRSLTATSRKMPVAAVTPKLAALITPAAVCVTEPVCEARRTVPPGAVIGWVMT